MPATDAQKAEIRLLSGDNADSESKHVVSNAQLDLWYDDIGTICGVVVKVIQALMAKAAQNIRVTEQGSPAPNPKVAQLQSLLDYHFQRCPEAKQSNSHFTINLGIDEETDLVDIE